MCAKAANDKQKDLVIAWLNDAYAMENAQIPTLENHAKDAKENPTISGRISRHVEETRRHADMVKDCVQRLGGDTSKVKGAMGSIMGKAQSVSTGMFKDELIKNALMDFTAENLEIASYKALIAAAEQVGDSQTAQTCRDILRDEEEMAHWLDEQLPNVVNEVIHKAA